RFSRDWSSDVCSSDLDHERNHEMYLRLLLGAAGADAEKAVREGEVLMAREPYNWQARATVALGQLRLGHPAAALQAFSGIKAQEIGRASGRGRGDVTW